MFVAHPPICSCADMGQEHLRGFFGSSRCPYHVSCCGDGEREPVYGSSQKHPASCLSSEIAQYEGHPNSHDPAHEATASLTCGNVPSSSPYPCSPQNLTAAILAIDIPFDAGDSRPSNWLSDAIIQADASTGANEGLGHHLHLTRSVTQALMISTRNPCALLSCWLC